MTVGELIKELKKAPKHANILIFACYTYLQSSKVDKMTVEELIEKLQEMPKDAEVKFGYRYDGIEDIETSISMVEFDDVDIILKGNDYG